MTERCGVTQPNPEPILYTLARSVHFRAMRHLVLHVLLSVSGACNAACFAEAASRYNVPEELLRAIATVESGNRPAAINMSHIARTKTYDIGLMQVNSSWLPKLAAMGIDEKMLREPCQNVMVGAWILAHHLRESGADWNGVGAYNASCRTLSKQQCERARYTYTWKVYQALLPRRQPVLPRRQPVPGVGAELPTDRGAAAVPQRSAGRVIRTVEVSVQREGETTQDGVQQERIARTAPVEPGDLNDEINTD